MRRSPHSDQIRATAREPPTGRRVIGRRPQALVHWDISIEIVDYASEISVLLQEKR